MIDLRSDTVTLPTPPMRRAMADADLGDDVFGEDPTVNRLQERAAELTGKEAALLVPSGTMGNQLGVLVNARRGDALLAESESHTFRYEAGAAAVVGGVQILPLATERGIFTPEQVSDQLSPDDPHYPPTTAIAVENTHNHQGGVVWPPKALEAVYELARRRGLRVHMDGARIFNAAAASGVPAKVLVAGADTVTFCLSKGLSCPAGSMFCGRADDVHEALRWRKMLGGGMRQAGVLAAAGLIALDTMIERLPEDHAHARTLAEALAELDGVSCDLSRVESNMVFVQVADAPRLADECRARGVLVLDLGPTTLRFVTHHGIEAPDIQRAIGAVADALQAVA